jgi:hypothetical protein
MLKFVHGIRQRATSARSIVQQAPKRYFSNPNYNNNFGSYAAMGAIGMGTAGMMYLMYRGSVLRNQAMTN